MTSLDDRIQALYQAALEIPEADRVDLASLIWTSVSPDPEIEASWSEEIGRRVQEIKSGEAELIPWAEVKKYIDQILDE
jgi:putative addiction module component (TIGR02574 family)